MYLACERGNLAHNPLADNRDCFGFQYELRGTIGFGRCSNHAGAYAIE